MDPRYSAQEHLLCDLCQKAALQSHCELCQINLCKACVGEHLSDSSKRHNVVPYRHRTSTPNYPKCPNHTQKHCELYCEKCDIPVCSNCLSSGKHKGHDLLDALQKLSSKTKDLENDLEELEEKIYPKYKEMTLGHSFYIFRDVPFERSFKLFLFLFCHHPMDILAEKIRKPKDKITLALDLNSEKVNLEKHYKKLTTAVTKQGEDWHRDINIIVNKQKSEIDEMKSEHLAALNKQEKEIKQITSDVKQSIVDLKKILDSNDVSLTSAYKPRNAQFRRLPPRANTSLPSFHPHQINRAMLHQMFGSLSALSITTEEQGYKMEEPKAISTPKVKPILDEPELITTIDTMYDKLCSVTCLNDGEIWTFGNDEFLKLYNLHGKILKSIQTKSGNRPWDIAVTRSGDLVYIDQDTRTVNIVKNEQIQEVIRLQGWIPYYVCSTSSDDLLVTMTSTDYKKSKVVRYSGSTRKQTIQFDSEGTPLYLSCSYITENRNLDICVADYGASAVVVVNQAGTLRFRYTATPSTTKGSFIPYGITTDSQSQILTADCHNNCIHILDQNGQLLRYINNCDLQDPMGLCVDTRDNLFVTEFNSGKVKKIKYM
ncbi:uncharacterized protein LOC134272600 [Saccostrea cucullata]|uniref:uncharacterized protein LOC134272600 n=1 Tax=Saccostrea cuccullata TaxID=36930 RepID=UPI002ED12C64